MKEAREKDKGNTKERQRKDTFSRRAQLLVVCNLQEQLPQVYTFYGNMEKTCIFREVNVPQDTGPFCVPFETRAFAVQASKYRP